MAMHHRIEEAWLFINLQILPGMFICCCVYQWTCLCANSRMTLLQPTCRCRLYTLSASSDGSALVNPVTCVLVSVRFPAFLCRPLHVCFLQHYGCSAQLPHILDAWLRSAALRGALSWPWPLSMDPVAALTCITSFPCIPLLPVLSLLRHHQQWSTIVYLPIPLVAQCLHNCAAALSKDLA